MPGNGAPQLLAALRARIADRARATEGSDIVRPTIFPPATDEEITVTEQALGFPLPPLLTRIYREVGNGGFGPGYGLVGVEHGARDDGDTLADLYYGFRQPHAIDPVWNWPERLVPLAHLGCAMYACVDCRRPQGSVVWWEPNPRGPGEPLGRFLIPVADSLDAWLWLWLRDADWMSPAFERSELRHWLAHQEPTE